MVVARERTHPGVDRLSQDGQPPVKRIAEYG